MKFGENELVYWNDPTGMNSGLYRVVDYQDDVSYVLLISEDGSYETEALEEDCEERNDG